MPAERGTKVRARCYLQGMADEGKVLDGLCEVLELDKGALKGHEELAELESWNSLAVLGVIAFADENCGVTLSPEKIMACRTVAELVALVRGSNGA